MLIPYNRTSIERRTASAYFEGRNLLNGQPIGVPQNLAHSYSWSNFFQGFKQPGWRRVIRDKQNATTSASGNKVTPDGTYSIGEIEYKWTDGLGIKHHDRYNCQGANCEFHVLAYGHTIPLQGTIPWSQIRNSALIGFLKKAKAAQRQFQSGVFLGELRQTLHLIKRPASSLRSLFTDYVEACRRGSRRLSPKDQLRHVSNQWLEYSFGMLPLISDIESGVRAAERLHLNLPSKYIVHAVSEKYWAYVDVISTTIWSGYFPVYIYRKAERFGGRRICGEVRLAQREPNFSGFNQSLGLTIRDFIPTIYELIPYSFLVDYFVNIGEILEAMSLGQADLIWQSSTEITRDIEHYQLGPRSAGVPNIHHYDLSPSTFSRTSSTYSRSGSYLGLPVLAFKVPGNWSKFLNIGALATMRALRT